MSDSESKAPGQDGTKRRRRRRRGGRDGEGARSSKGSDSGSGQASESGISGGSSGSSGGSGSGSDSSGGSGSDSSGGSGGGTAGRSKRRRGGRSRGGKNEGPGKKDRGGNRDSSGRRASSSARKSDGERGTSRSSASAASTSKKPQGRPRFESPKPDEGTSDFDANTPAPESIAPATRWGDDSDSPTPDIQLAADMPANAPSADLDPTSVDLLTADGGYDGQLSARICNVIGVRYVPAGRTYLFDAGDGHYAKGETVVVESERGQRTATVTTASCRRPPPRSLKRIVRRGSLGETGDGASKEEELQRHLSTAKAKAKELSLAIKVFRTAFEDGGKTLGIYYSCEDKTDVRPLTRALTSELPIRIELRHTGVRDEAKLVGGIGACGQELCCTTWLPSFVPVSIKHAKDQGLALTPNKISGLCGRLKCCLVYEQENYARLRKGLPKLGKRVITNDGFEGRVIELDVLHGRIRVSVGRGESKVYKKGEVEPMFASQPQGQAQSKSQGSGRRDKKDSSEEKQGEKINDEE